MVELLPRGGLNRRLDEALERMAAGKDPTEAAGLQWNMATLQDLLQAAAILQEIPREVAEPPTRVRVRNRFMTQAASRRVAWVHRHSMPLKAKRRPVRTTPRIGSLSALLLLGLVALVAGSITAVAADFSEPDSPLYPLKELGEGALAAMTVDPVSNADLKVTYASQRLREAEAMAARGHSDLAVDSVRGRLQDLRESAQSLLGESSRTDRWIRVRDRLVEEEGRSLTPIEQTLEGKGDTDAAAEVRQLAANFDSERKTLDKELTAPVAKPAAPVSPTPTRAPTRKP
jgi:hypothetical protein